MRPLFALQMLALAGGFTVSAFAATPPVSAAYMTPSSPWKEYPTRTLADLPDYRPTAAPALSPFGGLKVQPQATRGFFRIERQGPRWWLIDPDGYRFINTGVVAVTLPERLEKSAGVSRTAWAAETVTMLRENGFNGLGAWSDTVAVPTREHPVVYTRLLNFMATYASKKGALRLEGGKWRYPHDAMPVFDPEFAVFCNEFARPLADTRDDRWLLGTFSDNELPFQRMALENFLQLPAADAGRIAAENWLRDYRTAHPGETGISDEMRDAFLGYMADRYLSVTTSAIRRYDPNHLCLGPRLHGGALRAKALFTACGRHLDVIGINYYHAWTPDADLMKRWTELSGRPFLITEWYAKGMDSGFPNTTGAGWVVKTQADRGLFYQNFALGLLESPGCVGWHWFKYQDNDPNDSKAGASNIDSNKGIVNLRFEPYKPLTNAMRELNAQIYSLVDYFDARTR